MYDHRNDQIGNEEGRRLNGSARLAKGRHCWMVPKADYGKNAADGGPAAFLRLSMVLVIASTFKHPMPNLGTANPLRSMTVCFVSSLPITPTLSFSAAPNVLPARTTR